MRFFEMHKYLQQHGFSLHRQGSKHAIYSNGETELTVPRGRKVEQRLSKHIKIVVRKARDRKDSKNTPTVNTVQECLPHNPEAEKEESYLISKKKTTIYQRVLDCCTKFSGTSASLSIADIMGEIGEREPDFLALVTAIRKAEDIEKLFGLRDALELVGIKNKRVQKGIEEFERFTRPIKVVEEKKVEEIAAVIVHKAAQVAAQVATGLATQVVGAVPQAATGMVIKSRGLTFSEKQTATLDIIKILGTLPDADARQEVMEQVQGFNNMR